MLVLEKLKGHYQVQNLRLKKHYIFFKLCMTCLENMCQERIVFCLPIDNFHHFP